MPETLTLLPREPSSVPSDPLVSVVVISKNEPELDATLAELERQVAEYDGGCELLVVDASEGRLDEIGRRHPGARWLRFEPLPGASVTIPHQRNTGVRATSGEIVVFTDAGCVPRLNWLSRITEPIRTGAEEVVAGATLAPGGESSLYDAGMDAAVARGYVTECPTINLAFRRDAFEEIGGFDERFEYGSDVDFSWRLVGSGRAIAFTGGAVVEHEWGRGSLRQLKRAFRYGKARARLYGKHRDRLAGVWREDPITLAYPLFLLGLPLTRRFRPYPLLLVIPAVRNRHAGATRVLADHLAFGAGILAELAGGRL